MAVLLSESADADALLAATAIHGSPSSHMPLPHTAHTSITMHERALTMHFSLPFRSFLQIPCSWNTRSTVTPVHKSNSVSMQAHLSVGTREAQHRRQHQVPQYVVVLYSCRLQRTHRYCSSRHASTTTTPSAPTANPPTTHKRSAHQRTPNRHMQASTSSRYVASRSVLPSSGLPSNVDAPHGKDAV